MVVYGQTMLYSGESCCIWAKKVVLGKSGCIRVNVVVFGQCSCDRAMWLYSAKLVLFEQTGCIQQNGCIRAK